MLTKRELSEILHSLPVQVGEGEQFLISKGQYPKVAYFELQWEDNMASGDDYEEIITYQVSFAGLKPRDPALLQLKQALNDRGLHPIIQHEYVNGDNAPAYHHSFFSLDVTEDLT